MEEHVYNIDRLTGHVAKNIGIATDTKLRKLLISVAKSQGFTEDGTRLRRTSGTGDLNLKDTIDKLISGIGDVIDGIESELLKEEEEEVKTA
jgi:hypothetical protein